MSASCTETRIKPTYIFTGIFVKLHETTTQVAYRIFLVFYGINQQAATCSSQGTDLDRRLKEVMYRLIKPVQLTIPIISQSFKKCVGYIWLV